MSNDRDRELDELESALKGVPHIEKPDALNIGDGTACWINQDRMCEPTCRAYDFEVQPAQGPDVCRVLNALTDIPEVLSSLLPLASILKKKAQDQQRTGAASAPVPDPTGRTRT